MCGCVRKQEGDWCESVGEEEQTCRILMPLILCWSLSLGGLPPFSSVFQGVDRAQLWVQERPEFESWFCQRLAVGP